MPQSLHTAEQLRRLSNVGHWIEGGILGAVGIVALMQSAGYLSTAQWPYLWPGFVLLAGLTLLMFMLLHHGVDQVGAAWRLMTSDPQQRQHLLMAGLLCAAGAAETLSRMHIVTTGALAFAWPAGLAIIGALFTIHKQHGSSQAVTWAMRVHRYLGVGLIAAGISRAASIIYEVNVRWLAFVWPTLLLLSAVLLVAYREPEGAYEDDAATHAQLHSSH